PASAPSPVCTRLRRWSTRPSPCCCSRRWPWARGCCTAASRRWSAPSPCSATSSIASARCARRRLGPPPPSVPRRSTASGGSGPAPRPRSTPPDIPRFRAAPRRVPRDTSVSDTRSTNSVPAVHAGRPRAALPRRAAALLGGAILALVAVLPASAHAVKQVGAYKLAIGWAVEPSYVGFDNAVEVIASDASGKPVGDLKPGDFKVPLIPTVVGAYTFHVTGSVHGTPVDQTVTASDQTFAVVTEPSDDQFPAKVPSSAALSTKLDATASRLAAAQQVASDASSSAGRAMVIGVVALAAGVLLGGAGLGVAARRRRV